MSADNSATHLRSPDIALRVGGLELEGISVDQLRAVVQMWTQMLREDGLPPEKVLPIVKTFVRESVMTSICGTDAETDESLYRRDLLVKRASAWCIEAYFAELRQAHMGDRI